MVPDKTRDSVRWVGVGVIRSNDVTNDEDHDEVPGDTGTGQTL